MEEATAAGPNLVAVAILMPLLALRDISRSFSGARVLSGVSFDGNSAARLQAYAGRTVRLRARVSSPARSPLALDLIAIE